MLVKAYAKEIIIVILLIVVFFLLKQCRTEQKENKNLSQELAYLNDTLIYVRLDNGFLQAEKHSAQLTVEQLQATNGNLIREIKGLKAKNIEGITEVTSVTRDTVFASIRDTMVDSIQSQEFTFEDRWLSLDGLIVDRDVRIHYESRDSLSLIKYWKKPDKGLKLFKKKELFINIMSYNENSTITGVKDVTISQPKTSRLGWGLNLSYGFTVPELKPNLHIGIGGQVRF